MIATKAVEIPREVRFHNILFATDFSSASNAALPYAAGLAKMFDSKLFAMHVKEPVNYTLPPEMWQAADRALELEMQELRGRLDNQVPHINTQLLEGEGGFWPALASAVEQNQIDLIVVGTRGRTGIGKALLGSQAEELLRQARCPVLTVGPHAQLGNEPHGNFASILFATDFGPDSAAAVPFAIHLAQETKAKLNVLHVIKKMKANDLAIPEQFAEADEQKLRQLVPGDEAPWCAPRYIVEAGEPKDKILEVADRVGADLVVLGVHKRSGVPGAGIHLPIATVHHVVAHAKCPVLTIHTGR